MNRERTSRGLPPLEVNLQLLRIARHWSAVMARDGQLKHRPDLTSHVFGPWDALAENVGQGTHSAGASLSSTVDRVHAAFMASSGHRANVLGTYDLVAAGVVVRNGRLWVTVNFLRGPASGFPLFRDVGGTVHEWRIGAVWLEDVASGCRFSDFCGTAEVSRAQMATFLARALELAPVAGQSFTDVDPASPHAGNINAITKAGVMDPCDAQGPRFCPDDPVTRAAMATFLARARKLEPVTTVRFADVSPTSPHFGNINAIAEAEITTGCDSDGRLYCPDATVPRAQMSTFIARTFWLSGSFWRVVPTTATSASAPY